MWRKTVYRIPSVAWFRKTLPLILVGGLGVMALGWLGDAVGGICIWERWLGPCADGWAVGKRSVVALLLFLALSTLSAWLAHEFLPVLHFSQNSRTQPRKVLIVPLSTFTILPVRNAQQRWQLEVKGSAQSPEPTVVELSNDLAQDLARLEANEGTKKWNGMQFLRGLCPHVCGGVLEQLYLIGSKGSQGSSAQLETVRAWVQSYTAAQVHAVRDVDFHSVKTLQAELEKIIRSLLDGKQYRESDIMIDTTGGTKTASIAAAFASLEWRGVEFQYVQTGDGGAGTTAPEVLSYNVVAGRPQSG